MPPMFAQRFFTVMDYFSCLQIGNYFFVLVILSVNDAYFIPPLTAFTMQIISDE